MPILLNNFVYSNRLLTGSVSQGVNKNEFQHGLNQQLSPQEKTFLSHLLTNSSHAKDVMAKKTAHALANDIASFKPGKAEWSLQYEIFIPFY